MAIPVAVLFLTHRWGHTISRKFARLVEEVGDGGDVFLLIRDTEETARNLVEIPPEGGEIAPFKQELLPEILGFRTFHKTDLVPGSTHFPLLAFHRQRPTYDSYFVIEYDVEFTGNWGDLVRDLTLRNLDLVSTHYYAFEDKQAWPWWSHYRPSLKDCSWALEAEHLRRTFNPVYCLSRRAIELIEAAHCDGWVAHYEMLLATIMTNRDCRIVDLKELGYCAGRAQDLREVLGHGELSTVRWLPEIRHEEVIERIDRPTLFHPVKGDWFFDGKRIVPLPHDETID